MIGDRFTTPFTEHALDWTARRQKVLSSNLANVDTPGFRARDMSFEPAIHNATPLKTTSAQHIGMPAVEDSVRTFEVETTVRKANGNSVDLDRELSAAVKNGVQYLTLIQFVNQKLRTIRSGISEGGRV